MKFLLACLWSIFCVWCAFGIGSFLGMTDTTWVLFPYMATCLIVWAIPIIEGENTIDYFKNKKENK